MQTYKEITRNVQPPTKEYLVKTSQSASKNPIKEQLWDSLLQNELGY